MKSCDVDLAGCGRRNGVNHFLQRAPRVFTLNVSGGAKSWAELPGCLASGKWPAAATARSLAAAECYTLLLLASRSATVTVWLSLHLLASPPRHPPALQLCWTTMEEDPADIAATMAAVDETVSCGRCAGSSYCL